MSCSHSNGKYQKNRKIIKIPSKLGKIEDFYYSERGGGELPVIKAPEK